MQKKLSILGIISFLCVPFASAMKKEESAAAASMPVVAIEEAKSPATIDEGMKLVHAMFQYVYSQKPPSDITTDIQEYLNERMASLRDRIAACATACCFLARDKRDNKALGFIAAGRCVVNPQRIIMYTLCPGNKVDAKTHTTISNRLFVHVLARHPKATSLWTTVRKSNSVHSQVLEKSGFIKSTFMDSDHSAEAYQGYEISTDALIEKMTK